MASPFTGGNSRILVVAYPYGDETELDLQLEAHGHTSPGSHNEENQDSFLIHPASNLYLVADGVGGGQAGSVASRTIKEETPRRISSLRSLLAGFRTDRDQTRRPEIFDTLNRVVNEIGKIIYTRSQKDEALQGMSSTLTIMAVADRTGFIAHVGDSRAYLIRKRKVYQLTEDHTLAYQLYTEGILTQDEFDDYPYRNVIDRALGLKPNVTVDTLMVDVFPGDIFILCSDGMSDVVQPEQILEISGKVRIQELPYHLVNLAKQMGTKDDVTVVTIKAGPEQSAFLEAQTVVMDITQKLDFLRELFLFRFLNDQELLKVFKIIFERRYGPGDVVITEGSQGDELFIVVEGTLDVTRKGIYLTSITHPGHFGELALVDNKPRSATVAARDNALLFSISKKDFFNLTRHDPGLATKLLWAFLQQVSNRVRDLSDQLADIRRQGQ